MGRIHEITVPDARSALCRKILADLPDWFGRPDATRAYVDAIADLTTFAWEADGIQAGVAALSWSTSATLDMHVLGVLRRYHGRGGGRALLSACEGYARAAGATFLTVQTLGPSVSDPFYERTRAFYEACGMAALAEFSDHWGPETPMLLMAKAV